MTKSAFKLLFMRDGKSAQTVIRFTCLRCIAAIVTVLLILGALIYPTSRYLAYRLTHISMAEVVNENRELRQELDGISQRLKDVNHQLQDIYKDDDMMRVMADMPKIDDDTRQVGIGGSVAPDFDYKHEDETVRKLIFDLDKIEREIRLQRSSFVEIHRKFIENADLILHTPSLRPVEGGYVSSGFGWRPDPFTNRRTHHKGIDFCVERGTPIYVTANGKTIFAKRTPGMGKLVIIDHGYGFRTAYGHMDKIFVKNGQTVERGQKIGEVGNTGRSTGPHLHYEVHVNRKAVDPIDYLYDNFAVRSID